MKFVFLIGNAAVGKMTVGQELMKITDLRLFHNHMTIEPVIEIFGRFEGQTIARLREVIFEAFAASQNKGMIFTYMWAFDEPSDWAYVERVKSIFREKNPETTFYYVELVASKAVRLERNATENRLKNKASKRDLTASTERLLNDDRTYRCESYEGEIEFENYLRIDNSVLTPQEVARQIQAHFDL